MTDATNDETITVMYSCRLCGITRIPVAVRVRVAGEDIRGWMAALGYAIKFDHVGRSPKCTAREIADLLIPMTGREFVGGPMTH